MLEHRTSCAHLLLPALVLLLLSQLKASQAIVQGNIDAGKSYGQVRL